MVILVFLLSFFVLFVAVSGLLSRKDVRGTYLREGPGRISEHLRKRSRVIVGAILAVLAGVALLEVLIPDVHYTIVEAQYQVGLLLNSGPAGVIDLSSGGGISWALYLAILVGTMGGVIVGTWLACRALPMMRGVSPLKLI